MEKQGYSNHIRYYIPHHFIFYPVSFILILTGALLIFRSPGAEREWIGITLAFIMITWVAYMMRQHYALTTQNRIVRLELRLRYYQLTGQRLESVEHMLSFPQLAALRFASDEELPALVERTIKENLTPDTIKKAIINWLPDTMRV